MVKIALGDAQEHISDVELRRFLDSLPQGTTTFAFDDGAGLDHHLLAGAAAVAPSLANEVLELRVAIRRALTEGCPRAGKRCSWCGTDLTLAVELHHRNCPWLAILNTSSRLDRLPPNCAPSEA